MPEQETAYAPVPHQPAGSLYQRHTEVTVNGVTHTLTDEQENTRAWFVEHMVWAVRHSTVARAIRDELAVSGMPDDVAQALIDDVVSNLVDNGYSWELMVPPAA